MRASVTLGTMTEIYLYDCCTHCGCNPKRNNHTFACPKCQDTE